MRKSHFSGLDATRSEGYRPPPKRFGDDTLGALAELAVCRYYDLGWEKSVGTFNGRLDVPGVGEVKSTWRANGCLIYREWDSEEKRYTLVIVDVFDPEAVTATLVGHIEGRVVKEHPEWIRNPRGTKRAHFVPQWALTPLSPDVDVHPNGYARAGVGTRRC